MFISRLLVHEFLENSASLYPDKIAVIHDGCRYTYSEINGLANNLAGTLRSCGVIEGDRIAIILENSIEYIISYYAAMKCGGIAVPLSSDLRGAGLKSIFSELECSALITSSKSKKIILETGLTDLRLKAMVVKDPVKVSVPGSHKVISWDDAVSGDFSGLKITVSPDNLSSIIYTSGSTGLPKGVMLTHSNIAANTESICSYLKLTSEDRQMVVLPFSYVFGQSLLNTHFAAGGSVVINNRFAYTASVLKQMEEESVTGFSGVPSTYAYLLHRSPLHSYMDRLPYLRYCSQAGGHMPRRIKQDLRKILPPHTDIYIMYGATEASARIAYLPPARLMDKIESIGIPVPVVELMVVDVNGEELKHGETGELVASGPNIMKGYWRDSELTSAVLDCNGYHTGDMGYKDDEGFFYLTGRKDLIFKIRGYKVNPREVEDALIETGLVIEAAVIGVPDDISGTRLVAYSVAVDDTVTENDIIKKCLDILPKYALPAELKLIKALPKKGNGKIDISSLAVVEMT
jgi:acyl-CoA synthetase (AMP-forming)/AMP-acid ligase II